MIWIGMMRIRTMAALKPIKCDCGNEELDIFTQTDWDGETEYVVMCQHCKTVSTGPTKEKAISDWNRAINLKSFME